ncbi:MAG: hypothetical protein K2M97_04085 [Muribaculaceae bacterium]|nr:hypothetical protein [Muribaculaceae bacterium]
MLRKNKRTAERKKSDKTSDSFMSRLIHGRLLTGGFFARYWGVVIFVVALLLTYITGVFSARSSMENIARLQDRLAVVQTESIRVRGEYMSRIRESEMRARLDSLGIPLSVSEQPPFHLKSSK